KGFKTNADIFKEAEEIMGKDFLGPQAIENTFGIHLESKDIPRIPFSNEDLELAKGLSQFLILRTDKAPDGGDLTPGKMAKISNDPSSSIISSRKSAKAFKKEGMAKEVPLKGWALVSKMPLSYNTDIMSVNAKVIAYLKGIVFSRKEIPKEYEAAFKEYESALDTLASIQIKRFRGKGNKEEKNDIIKNLAITKLTEPSVSEVVYDSLVYERNNGTRLYKQTAILTRSCSSSKGFVFAFSNGEDGRFYIDFIDYFDSWKRSGTPGGILSRRS
ncbi:MAG: hypothetical protein Q7S53_05240, partial [bacterium]|nr:hypothetical protein [bacterium]